ncbi:MAG: hypothetical protein HYR96_12835 [Deltaproteobacteria bacterium]|nr:hypothetical protein [Deltaproteobacteria bacterium]MBI3294325.1 hypothetical protein [Deltaproteobacteria bacterium]
MIVILLCFLSLLAQGTEKKPWTLLFYVAGDESQIDKYSRLPIRKLEQVGSSSDKWIVAHVDLHVDEYGEEVIEEPPVRYEVAHRPGPVDTADYQTLKIESPVVWRGDRERNSGDPSELGDFLAWGMKNYPAQHYALFLLGHSWGWRGLMEDDRPGFALPEGPAGREFTLMPLEGVEQALAQGLGGRKLDLVVMDSCHGGVLEVLYSFKNYAQYFLAAATEMTMNSYDYQTWVAKSWSDLPSVLKAAGQEFLKDYARGGKYVEPTGDHSAINLFAVDLEKMEPVWRFLQTMPSMGNFAQVFLGEENHRHQDEFGNLDLFEFLAEVKSKSYSPSLRIQAQELIKTLGIQNDAPDSVFRELTVPPGATQFRLWLQGDELIPSDLAVGITRDELEYYNPSLKEIQGAKIQMYQNYGQRFFRVDSGAVQSGTIALRPFVAGGTWARVEWLDRAGRVVEEVPFSAPVTFSFQKQFPPESPFVFSGHTFGAGRNRGPAVQIQSVLDRDLGANYAWLEGRWVFGNVFYKTTPFSKFTHWGDLIF